MMDEKTLENRLNAAIEHAAPDDLGSVLSACAAAKGDVPQMTEQPGSNPAWRRFAAAAAAAVLLAAAGFGGYAMGRRSGAQAPAPALTAIIFDVNPSVELIVDESETVREALALNVDGERVLGGMNLGGVNLETAANALIGAFLRYGYLDDLQNTILISFEGRDGSSARLEAELSRTVNALLQSGGVNALVLTQSVGADEARSALAQRYGVSGGKAALIQEIVAQDAALRFEDLSRLTVTELARLTEGRSLAIPSVSQTGRVSDGGYIGADAALQAACTQVGVGGDGCQDPQVELDCEDGRMAYEVEFCYDGTEYDFEIDALTGAVLEYDTDRCDHHRHHH